MRRKDIEKLMQEKGLDEGFIFGIANGRMLDVYGKGFGVPRKRWWIFKETDSRYKTRLLEHELRNRGLIDSTE